MPDQKGKDRPQMRVVRWFLVGVVLAVVMVVAIGVWVDRSRPVQIVVSALPARQVVVQIEGAVVAPGMVAVSGEARLADVIEAAGGLAVDADLSGLNLAGRVGDGERVVIPGALTGQPAEDVSTASTSTDRRLNLNTATAAELEALPGIGSVIAGRIIELREQNGGYSSVDELVQVKGVSPRLLEELRPLVTVDAGS